MGVFQSSARAQTFFARAVKNYIGVDSDAGRTVSQNFMGWHEAHRSAKVTN
jgi:hypothetical protein